MNLLRLLSLVLVFTAAGIVSLLTATARAVVIADDTFAYTVGSAIAGNSGGTGWGGAWGNTGTNTSATVIDTTANPLEYTPPAGSLLGGGNQALQVFLSGATGNEVAASRQFAAPLASTFYVGYLVRYDGTDFAGANNTFTLHLSNTATSTTSINFGLRGDATGGGTNNEFVVRSATGGPGTTAANNAITFGGQLVNGTEYYLVGKLTYDTTSSTFNKAEVWLNPETNDPTPDATWLASTNAVTALSSITHAFFRQAANQNATGVGGQDTYVADRLVVGSTWEDVVGEIQPAPGLVIDRATGQATLENTFGVNLNVVGYSLGSAGGALKTSLGGWTPIAGRLDQTGNGSFDNNGTWSVSSNTASSLAEGVATGNGGQLGPAATVGLGPAWLTSPIEDVTFSYQLEGGVVKAGGVRYTGTSPLRGDFDRDGALDKDDFVILSQGSYKDLATQTTVSAYFMGDIDLDKDNDFNDFTIFKQLYIAANGSAAFATLTAVPEPGTLAIMFIGLGLLLTLHGRGNRD